MKKLLLTIVQVKRIDFDDCTATIDEFSEDMLAKAAQSSLEIGGFVIPPTLLRTGSELNPSYHILVGHFQCYAALRAYKLEPLRGETIPAVVIRDDDPKLDLLMYQLNYITNGGNS